MLLTAQQTPSGGAATEHRRSKRFPKPILIQEEQTGLLIPTLLFNMYVQTLISVSLFLFPPISSSCANTRSRKCKFLRCSLESSFFSMGNITYTCHTTHRYNNSSLLHQPQLTNAWKTYSVKRSYITAVFLFFKLSPRTYSTLHGTNTVSITDLLKFTGKHFRVKLYIWRGRLQ